MKNYERVIKIIDLVKEIVTSDDFKTGILSIMHDTKEAICEKLDEAKEWVEEAVSEEN